MSEHDPIRTGEGAGEPRRSAADREARRLTELVLGELDAAEARALEARLARDPELAERARELRELSAALGRELAGTATSGASECESREDDGLGAARRAALLAELPTTSPANEVGAAPSTDTPHAAGRALARPGARTRGDRAGRLARPLLRSLAAAALVYLPLYGLLRSAGGGQAPSPSETVATATPRERVATLIGFDLEPGRAQVRPIPQTVRAVGGDIGPSPFGNPGSPEVSWFYETHPPTPDHIVVLHAGAAPGTPAQDLSGFVQGPGQPELVPLFALGDPPQVVWRYMDFGHDLVLEPGVRLDIDGLDIAGLDDLDGWWTRVGRPFPTRDFEDPRRAPFSTFALEVDRASYALVRRALEDGHLPEPGSVRLEEVVNALPYDAPGPTDGRPLAVTTEVGACPWRPEHLLLRVSVRALEVPRAERKPTHLVFLIDTSGSMEPGDRLPLLQEALVELIEQLDERDRVSLVTYASGTEVVLPPTRADRKDELIAAVRGLSASGSTNGAGGLELAYRQAREAFLEDGVNRVLLCTDGDFNVGPTDPGQLARDVERAAVDRIRLTVLGVGTGNFADARLETITNAAEGEFHYLDSRLEAHRVLVQGLVGTLETVARDVKLQLDFNPGEVAAYRLLGYENRALAARDFLDDAKDAGELGSGHTSTALYELVPTGAVPPGAVQPSRYAAPARETVEPVASLDEPRPEFDGEACVVRVRYKRPDRDDSEGFEVPVRVDDPRPFEALSADTRLAASAAAFAEALRRSPHRGGARLADVERWLRPLLDDDEGGHRAGLLRLVERARALGLD